MAGSSELCFASDSRLSSGSYIDCCQKVFSLPRGDGAIAFAGSTAIAYPFLKQVLSVLKTRKDMRERTTDFSKVPSLIRKTLNSFVDQHSVHDNEDFLNDLRSTSFLIGGWSAINQRFILRRLAFHNGAGKYVLVRKTDASMQWGLEKRNSLNIAFAGDYIHDVIVGLKDEFEKTGVFKNLKMNYEPLTVLKKLLLNPNYTSRDGRLLRPKVKAGSIGGNIQFLKVYNYSVSNHFIVPGILNSDENYFQGRAVLPDEKLDAPNSSPDLSHLLSP